MWLTRIMRLVVIAFAALLGCSDSGGSGAPPPQLIAGAHFTCAFDHEGKLCWGENRDNELGAPRADY